MESGFKARIARCHDGKADFLRAVHVHRSWRVQQSNLLGACMGGLRWAASVILSVLRALAFEQVFKNALTGLPMGAPKGGTDFDRWGRSGAEIERFA